MRCSQSGLDLIKEFEGLVLKAAPDIAGVPTVGYGTIMYPNGTKVKNGETCTLDQADYWLQYEASEKADVLTSQLIRLGIVLNQNEFDATLSFIYNLGIGIIGPDRSFGAMLRTNDKKKIADSMLLYCKYKGLFGIMRVSKGLLNRRQKEVALFLKPYTKVTV